MKLYFLGPKGTYSELGAKKIVKYFDFKKRYELWK